MFAKLWNDESGVIAVEYLFLVTIIGLSLAVGYSAVARAVNVEYIELARAILSLDQSYSYTGISTCTASSGATTVTDIDGTISASNVTDAAPGSASINACALTP